MQIIVTPSSKAGQLEETRRQLIDMAYRRFGQIPAELLVEHVLAMTSASGPEGEADFPVRRAAVEALGRRWGFAARDGLAVATCPADGALGAYTTTRSKAEPAEGVNGGSRRSAKKPENAKEAKKTPRRGRSAEQTRPFTTTLESLEPLSGSCDCFDFLRSSLGLCKHLLVVLDHVFASPERLSQVRRRARGSADPGTTGPRLVWEPGLPLRGSLDRLTGLRFELRREPTFGSAKHAKEWQRLRRQFGRGVLESVRLDPERRSELLTRLAELLANDESWLGASPAAKALVREELERSERSLDCARSMPAALAALSTLKRRLYPYQQEGVERFLSAGRLLLADDMGLGKTTQAIASCHALFESGRVRRGLVIVPASLKSQWKREWNETTSVPIAIADGSPEERARQYRDLDRGFLLLNYEQLLRDADAIREIRPEIVVLDEAQRIKNYATKSAMYVKSLTPAYRLVLTGTPMENRLEELASVLDWVDDIALAPKWRLVPWYTRTEGDGSDAGVVGARNLDTLRARMSSCVVRRVRRDVLEQLPPRTDTNVPVEMTAQQRLEHDELVQPIASLVNASRRRPLTQAQFLRLMQLLTQQRIIANGLGQVRFEELWPTYSHARPDPALLDGLFSPKLVELRRLVVDLVVAQGRKVVIFSQWRRMLRLAEWSVRDVLGDEGFRAVFFTGAEKQSERTKSVVDFHDDPRVRVMFLSDAGGVGLNLQRAASACINLELPWNPAVLEQRIGRIFRLGQDRPIDVYNLIAEASIEGRIAGLVDAKHALFSGLFDGTSDEIRFESSGSFLGRVEQLVEPMATIHDGDDGDVEGGLDEGVATTDRAMADALVEVAPPPKALAPALAPGAPIGALLDALRVERTTSGAVRIEAPPEVADSLLALFEGMAKLLGDAKQG